MTTSHPIAKSVTASSARLGATGSLLGVAFVVLKLTGVIHWSWWLVTLPFYGPTAAMLAIGVVLLAVGGVFLGLAKIVEGGK